MNPTAAPIAARLLEALEDLADREAVLLRGGCYPEAIAVQRRATPLVLRLTELAGDLEQALRARVGALLSRRRETLAQLLERRTSLVAERQRVGAARRQLQKVASYGRAAGRPVRRRLNAAV
jgi:septal ring factor EnvC (AmiA/AmiB activator)